MHIIKERAEREQDLYREELDDTLCLSVDVPVPPSVNHIYYNTKSGGRRLTKKAENYIRDVRAKINDAIDKQGWVIPNRYVWLYIDMVYYFPDRRIRDASNCLKILLDVMQGTVFENDYIALPRIQSVEYDNENPRVTLHITNQTPHERKRVLEQFTHTMV